mmetsp:Transcript_49577/g.114521  ORF Transcript_49577/g.114521 Transcript_49577/m.114521 type:complete len:447 (+) Transcript_49577:585-1925(+)
MEGSHALAHFFLQLIERYVRGEGGALLLPAGHFDERSEQHLVDGHRVQINLRLRGGGLRGGGRGRVGAQRTEERRDRFCGHGRSLQVGPTHIGGAHREERVEPLCGESSGDRGGGGDVEPLGEQPLRQIGEDGGEGEGRAVGRHAVPLELGDGESVRPEGAERIKAVRRERRDSAFCIHLTDAHAQQPTVHRQLIGGGRGCVRAAPCSDRSAIECQPLVHISLEHLVRFLQSEVAILRIAPHRLEQGLRVTVWLPDFADDGRLRAEVNQLLLLARALAACRRCGCLGGRCRLATAHLGLNVRGVRSIDREDGDVVLHIAYADQLGLVHVLDELGDLLVRRLLGVKRRLLRRPRGLHVVRVELVRGDRHLAVCAARLERSKEAILEQRIGRHLLFVLVLLGGLFVSVDLRLLDVLHADVGQHRRALRLRHLLGEEALIGHLTPSVSP